MLRIKDIQDKLLDLVGWEADFNKKNEIDNNLTISESGLYFQSQHPLLTLNNIRAIMPDGVDLSEYLERETRNGIAKTVHNFVTKKVLATQTRNILETRPLLDGAGQLKNIIRNDGRLVGYEITPARSIGVTMRINRIGLQTTGAKGIVRVYLLHSNFINPVKTFDFNLDKRGGFQWFETPELFLPYIDSNKNAGGSWYLVYNQNDLPNEMDAVNIGRDFSRDPNQCCGQINVSQSWAQVARFMAIRPFKVPPPENFTESPQMWDTDLQVSMMQTNFGINLEFTIGCDLTDFIIRQRHIFANVLAKQVACDMLRKIAMNPEVSVNRNQINVNRIDILCEIDGDTERKSKGLGAELSAAYDALALDTTGLDRNCLTCNKNGIRFGAIA